MTVVVIRGFRWVAEKNRVAHATPDRGRVTRTLCDLPAVDERYSYPAAIRCERCTEVADRQTK